MSRPGRRKGAPRTAPHRTAPHRTAPHRAARLSVEPLEPRWLMNADGRHPRPDPPVGLLDKSFGSLLESHSDAGSFARSLLQHPGRAKAAGLEGLRHALREHAGYAGRYGWGATLTHELDTHRRYAAAHH